MQAPNWMLDRGWSFTAEVGGVALDPAHATRSREEADASPLRCPDPDAEAAMIARIDEARSAGDTVGGVFEVVATGVPIGLVSVGPERAQMIVRGAG